jgi:beta-lactam-binding protein with PASTA domain
MKKNTFLSDMERTLRKVLFPHGKRGIVFYGLALFVGWLFIVLVMDMAVMPLYIKSGKEITAPNLVNRTFVEAQSITRAYRFEIIEDGTSFSNTVPSGEIAVQIPSAGTILKPGRRIHVVLSRGSRPLVIPNVVGKSPREAELIINSAGLEVVDQQWKASDKYSRGIVADQFPPGDKEAPENTGVILFVANGRHETNVVMPNLIDLGYHAALDTLGAYKFDLEKVQVQREEAKQILPDTVIDQHPDPGMPTNTRTEVDLVVSTSQ